MAAPRNAAARPPKALHRPATRDHLRAKKPMEQELGIVLEDVVEPVAPDYDAMPEAQRAGARAAHDAAMAAYRDAVEAATVWVRVRSIPRKAYDALVDAHPPTDKEKARAKERGEALPEYDPEGFCPALIHACLVEPADMAPDDVRAICAEWNGAEVLRLFVTCLGVNTRVRVPFGSASGGMLDFGRS